MYINKPCAPHSHNVSIHVYKHTQTDLYKHTHTASFESVSVQTRIHICIYKARLIFILSYMNVCFDVCTYVCLYVCMYICMYKCADIKDLPCLRFACMHVLKYIYIHMYVCMYVCIYVYIYIYIYI